MDTQNILSLLSTALQDMTAQARRLAQIIDEEAYALREANIEPLNESVQKKQQAVTELTHSDYQFRTILIKLGFEQHQDISLFLQNLQTTEQLQQLWQQYLSILEQCYSNNHDNSSLVSIGMRHTSRALEFLHSCIGEYGEQVYGSKGQKLSDKNQTIIAKA